MDEQKQTPATIDGLMDLVVEHAGTYANWLIENKHNAPMPNTLLKVKEYAIRLANGT